MAQYTPATWKNTNVAPLIDAANRGSAAATQQIVGGIQGLGSAFTNFDEANVRRDELARVAANDEARLSLLQSAEDRADRQSGVKDIKTDLDIFKANSDAARYNAENKTFIDAGIVDRSPLFGESPAPTEQIQESPVDSSVFLPRPITDEQFDLGGNQGGATESEVKTGLVSVGDARRSSIDFASDPANADVVSGYSDPKKAIAGLTIDAMTNSAMERFTPLISSVSERIQVARENFFTDDNKIIRSEIDKDGKMSPALKKGRDSVDTDFKAMTAELDKYLKNIPYGSDRDKFETTLRDNLGLNDLEKLRNGFNQDIINNLKAEKGLRNADIAKGKAEINKYRTTLSPKSNFKKYFGGDTDFNMNDFNTIKDLAKNGMHNAYSKVPDGVFAEAASRISKPVNNFWNSSGHLELLADGTTDPEAVSIAIADTVRQIVKERNENTGGSFAPAVFGLDPEDDVTNELEEPNAENILKGAVSGEQASSVLSGLPSFADAKLSPIPRVEVSARNSISSQLDSPEKRREVLNALRGK